MTEKVHKQRKLPVYMTVYASFFDTHAQLPILALFASALGADLLQIGVVIGIYSIFNILGNGIGGMAIDRWGWCRPLLVGLVLVNMALYGFQLVNSVSGLMLVRACHGLAGGILIPSTLASLSPQSGREFQVEHSKNVSFYGVAIGLAALTGPPFASIISSVYSFKAAYLGIALLMTFATALAVLFARESKNEMPESKPHRQRRLYFKISPQSTVACLFAFALMGGTGTIAAFMPLLARDIGYSQAGIGMLFGLFAFVVILLQSVRAISGKEPANLFITIVGGFVLLILSLVFIHHTDSRFFFTGAILLYGTGFGIIFPNTLSMVIKGTSAENKGFVMGVFFSFYSLGTALVPPAAGYIWQSVSFFSPPLTAASVVLSIIVLTMYLQQTYRKRNSNLKR